MIGDEIVVQPLKAELQESPSQLSPWFGQVGHLHELSYAHILVERPELVYMQNSIYQDLEGTFPPHLLKSMHSFNHKPKSILSTWELDHANYVPT